ncbi:hypothetical protein FRC11_004924 [Ceratobasidium sp. 423]|nr:hypothetical protein FRC11_004924 [Ceratobasidium sp. 423]
MVSARTGKAPATSTRLKVPKVTGFKKKNGVTQYTAKFGKPNWGEERSLSYKIFQETLTKEEKVDWRKKAEEAVQASREVAQIEDPRERAEFLKVYMRQFQQMLEELDEFIGVKMCAMILHQTPEGKHKISQAFSKSVSGFGKSPDFATAMGAFQKWYQDTAGKLGFINGDASQHESLGQPVDNSIPLLTVYPDFANDQYPLLPNLNGLGLDPARSLMRTYVSAIAHEKVMWKEIKAAMDYYFDPSRLIDGLPFDDPSHLALPIILLWLDFFLQCQTGEIPPEKRFQFLRIPAGEKPISITDSQETGREEPEGKGKKTILVFERTVTKCHHPQGMDYNKAALRYAEFVNTGLAEADDLFDAPEKWMDLPILGPTVPNPIISKTAEEDIRNISEHLPSSQRELTMGILNAAIEHEKHLPATDPLGVYRSDDAPPKAIPPPSDPDSWPRSMWAHRDYYRHLSKASPEGTVEHFETWQGGQVENLCHRPSGTLYGGKTGVIGVVRPLIQLLFNFSAIRSDFTPPEDPPTDYDLTRFPINEWPCLQQWIQDWTTAIEASTAILHQTSDERRQGRAALQSPTDDDEPIHRDPTPGPSSSRVQEPVPTSSSADFNPNDLSQMSGAPKPKPKKRRARKPGDSGGKGKGKARARDEDEDEGSECSPESEDSDRGPETNFEELDRTSQDDMSDQDLRSDFGLEPDDQFPPDDPLRLHAKYDFDPKLARKSIEGTSSITTSSYAEYSQTDYPFGKFADLPEPILSRVTTPETVARVTSVRAVTVTRGSSRARNDW